MPAKGIHHVDLAVSGVEASLAFYLDLLGPLGWIEEVRYPTYRGTEDVIYLKDPSTGSMLGLRPADGPGHQYYGVGIEHLAFEVDTFAEVEEAHDVPGYYAVFIFDPDDIRIEVFSWPRSEP